MRADRKLEAIVDLIQGRRARVPKLDGKGKFRNPPLQGIQGLLDNRRWAEDIANGKRVYDDEAGKPPTNHKQTSESSRRKVRSASNPTQAVAIDERLGQLRFEIGRADTEINHALSLLKAANFRLLRAMARTDPRHPIRDTFPEETPPGIVRAFEAQQRRRDRQEGWGRG